MQVQAKDIMTRDVVSVGPDLPAAEIARLLVEHGISAAPVIDAAGAPIGMVSEGDLLGRSIAEREERRDWWLTMLAEGEALSPAFLATLHGDHAARDVMAAPVVTVNEATAAPEIARLLATHHIKRVPVVRDGRVVGIVSRADLLRALAAERPASEGSQPAGLIADAIASLDRNFHHEDAAAPKHGIDAPAATDHGRDAQGFRAHVAGFKADSAKRRETARHIAAEQRDAKVKTLIADHFGDDAWRSLLDQAEHAAASGETEFPLLRFPSQVCSDGGRAINVPQPQWPETLRGEAAEIYLRWERELRPHGFHLAARVLDFPGGFPGDIGLFLRWDD